MIFYFIFINEESLNWLTLGPVEYTLKGWKSSGEGIKKNSR